MRPLGTYRAAPRLPESLASLRPLAYDLRWSFRHEVRRLFRDLDPEAWDSAGGNPLELLRIVDPARLETLGASPDYVGRLGAVFAALVAEDEREPSVEGARLFRSRGERIAYFCAEFGLTEVLPIYSGGLGVLAGDHLKSASDLGVPLVAVGLFYREGFFRQMLTADSRQRESYPIVDPDDLPIGLLAPPSGVAPIVTVRIGTRDVHILVRRVQVGRVPLLLLDSHLPMNTAVDREITSRLYGGDAETRIKQEMVLGIGGFRALELADLTPTVCHANEGHATFLSIERIRRACADHGLSFEEAVEATRAGNVFTTHTPVSAGIDLFTPEIVRKYFAEEIDGLGITFEQFLGLGRQVPEDTHESFSMAVLGLRLSSRVNGVSKLHATVSRRLWRGVFPEAPVSEIPIVAVTNGVHPSTWTAPSIAELDVTGAPEAVDRDELWRRHEALRADLVNEVRERTAASRRRRGAPDVEIEAAHRLLDPSALTITFARRFATYKRATLVFQDPARLARILSSPGRPVQLLFAGKAHPKDAAGKDFIRRVGEFAQRPELDGRVVLLEDYDMRLARFLVSGSDVWLNNPRRPMEASGTSGMKAAMNGVLNLSVLDGWWDEAPRAGNGFTIGDGIDSRGDDEVAAALYDQLENEVVPLFYDRRGGDPAGRPDGWVDRMVGAASTLATLYSTDRMLVDYLAESYLPAADRARTLAADGHARARALAAWKARTVERWPELGFIGVQIVPSDPARLAPGTAFDVEVQVRLGGFTSEEVSVDWFEGTMDPDGVVDEGFSFPLALAGEVDGRATYKGTLTRPADDSRGYSVRLRPVHPDLMHVNEMGLVLWAAD